LLNTVSDSANPPEQAQTQDQQDSIQDTLSELVAKVAEVTALQARNQPLVELANSLEEHFARVEK
jgi:hypothetical protein